MQSSAFFRPPSLYGSSARREPRQPPPAVASAQVDAAAFADERGSAQPERHLRRSPRFSPMDAGSGSSGGSSNGSGGGRSPAVRATQRAPAVQWAEPAVRGMPAPAPAGASDAASAPPWPAGHFSPGTGLSPTLGAIQQHRRGRSHLAPAAAAAPMAASARSTSVLASGARKPQHGHVQHGHDVVAELVGAQPRVGDEQRRRRGRLRRGARRRRRRAAALAGRRGLPPPPRRHHEDARRLGAPAASAHNAHCLMSV